MRHLLIILSLLVSYINTYAQTNFNPDADEDQEVWEGVFKSNSGNFEVVVRLSPMAQNAYFGEIIYKKQGLPMEVTAQIGSEHSEGLKAGKPEPVLITEMQGEKVMGNIKGKVQLQQGKPVITGVWCNGQRSYDVIFHKTDKRFTDFIQPDAAMKKFPGFTTLQMKQLLYAAAYCDIPLPTFLPEGYKVKSIDINIGPRGKIAQEDKRLTITYENKQERKYFVIEGGFDGLGDVPWTATKTLHTAIGAIDFFYDPKDIDGSVLKGETSTQWFSAGSAGGAFMFKDIGQDMLHNATMGNADANPQRISKEVCEKIINSLKKL